MSEPRACYTELSNIIMTICIVVWQKPTQHCKTIILRLKIKLKKKRPLGKHQAHCHSHDRGERKRRPIERSEHSYKAIIAENFPNLRKNKDFQLQGIHSPK